MRWTMRFPLWLLIACLAQFVALARAGDVSVDSIVKNPVQYDHQTVTVRGTASAVKLTTSRAGNSYTTFLVGDANGNSVKVFTFGHPPVANGESVEIVGIFEQVKHVRNYTFYNEIDAQTVRPLGR